MQINFEKGNGLLPVIVQDSLTMQVLMLGYMNVVAYEKTRSSGKVTFYSRSRKKLWLKGETSGNFLNVVSMELDCDNDALLIQAIPDGVTCHTGTKSCFGKESRKGFIYYLESVIEQRINSKKLNSYTKSLYDKGINKIAQKVGEEAVELVIESKDSSDKLFKNEAADLLFHVLILLQKKGFKLNDIENVLATRHH